jgi:hypothetical protein
MRRLFLILLTTACGGGTVPTQGEIDDAKARVDLAAAASDDARSILELLGLLPTYECGEPRSLFLEDVDASIEASYGCATVLIDSTDLTQDTLTATFSEGGCSAAGHTVGGTLFVSLSGGEEAFSLELDAHGLVVDGRTIGALAGYGTCGDETRYWVDASGEGYSLDLEVAKRAGIPIIGGTTLLVSGSGTIRGDTVTLTAVEYEIGETLPHAGTITIHTADGHSIEATFSDSSPLYLEVVVRIDAHDAVTIPLPG